MESELVWLEWNFDLLKIFIDSLDDVNSAYKNIKDVARVDPGYADVNRRMESNYAAKRQQYDRSIRDIRSRIDRENKRLNSLDAEGRTREAQYIQDWNNSVRKIEEYIRTNVPHFLNEGPTGSPCQSDRTNSRTPFSPAPNPVRGHNAYRPTANSVSNNNLYRKMNNCYKSLFNDPHWILLAILLAIAIFLTTVVVIGYVFVAIVPLAAMVPAVEALLKIKKTINQPKEKNFFLYIRCVIPMVLNIIAIFLFSPILDYIDEPGILYLSEENEEAVYVKAVFFIQACLYGAAAFCFIKELRKKRIRSRV